MVFATDGGNPQRDAVAMMPESSVDWFEWHTGYDQADSPLTDRPRLLAPHIHHSLDLLTASLGSPTRIVSICAGQGKELLPALAAHPNGHNASVYLLELDARNVAVATKLADDLGLPHVAAFAVDAGRVESYEDIHSVGLAVLSGVMGNISEKAVENVAAHLSSLVALNGIVVWTCDNKRADHVGRSFESNGFECIGLHALTGHSVVGLHRMRMVGAAANVRRLFRFEARRCKRSADLGRLDPQVADVPWKEPWQADITSRSARGEPLPAHPKRQI